MPTDLFDWTNVWFQIVLYYIVGAAAIVATATGILRLSAQNDAKLYTWMGGIFAAVGALLAFSGFITIILSLIPESCIAKGSTAVCQSTATDCPIPNSQCQNQAGANKTTVNINLSTSKKGKVAQTS